MNLNLKMKIIHLKYIQFILETFKKEKFLKFKDSIKIENKSKKN